MRAHRLCPPDEPAEARGVGILQEFRIVSGDHWLTGARPPQDIRRSMPSTIGGPHHSG
jgi:hypothetical protein